MINFNFDSLASNEWMFGAIILYMIIMLAITFGNYLSVKFLNPTHKDYGRMFYGALIWFCTYIVVSIFTVAFFTWMSPEVTNAWIQPVAGLNLIAIIITMVAFYFETKFLFGYSWVKSILAVIIPIIIAVVVIVILWYTVPGWVKGCLFPHPGNLILF